MRRLQWCLLHLLDEVKHNIDIDNNEGDDDSNNRDETTTRTDTAKAHKAMK